MSGEIDRLLDRLRSGNRQFTWDGHPQLSQAPFAAILSCSDSRVIPERIFGAKEGGLFVVRVAGNVPNASSVASLEFAVTRLGVRLIVVLGHERCGAVESALAAVRDRLDLGRHLNQLVAHIIPAVNDPVVDDPEEAERANARRSADRIRELLPQAATFAAYFHLSTPAAGEVEWLS